MPEILARAARMIAERLQAQGYQSWLVGGCVRDLALGRTPKDVDMVTDAWPDRIEGLFPRTLAVGKAFGTVVVHLTLPAAGAANEEEDGQGTSVDVEVTTFRTERGYSDARRPDELTFAPSAEIDVLRRDFTCNALYLDPLSDTLLDPAAGMPDIAARQLRTVGPPADRFREDGLRLWRMARLEVELGFEPAPGLHAAARAERSSLRGVSVERVAAELRRILRSPRPGRGCQVVETCELWPAEWVAWLERTTAQEREKRYRMLPELPAEDREVTGLAALVAPAPVLELEPASPSDRTAARDLLLALRSSREELRVAVAAWDGLVELGAVLSSAARAPRVRLLRRPDLARITALALAADPAPDVRGGIEGLLAWGRSLAPDELEPEPWITSRDLAALGLEPGPEWGRILWEAEDRQLEGRFAGREEALAWLERAVQEGGNTRRRAKDSG